MKTLILAFALSLKSDSGVPGLPLAGNIAIRSAG